MRILLLFLFPLLGASSLFAQRIIYNELDSTAYALRTSQRGSMELEVVNVERAVGTVWLALYDSEQTWLIKEDATLVSGVAAEETPTIRFRLANIPFGRYALALIHDQDDNGTLNQNFIGIPTEPYGFAQPIRSRWRLPRFAEMAFDFLTDHQRVRVVLERW